MTPETLGKQVRWARKRARMTQHDLARAVDMPQSTIARIEAGAVIPRTATLMTLLQATGQGLTVEPIGPTADVEAIRRQLLWTPLPQRARRALGRRGKERATSPMRMILRLGWLLLRGAP